MIYLGVNFTFLPEGLYYGYEIWHAALSYQRDKIALLNILMIPPILLSLLLILHPSFFTLHPSTFSLTVEVGV